MNKYLITGAAGFVGKHCLDYFNIHEPKAEVMCIDKGQFSFDRKQFKNLNIIEKSVDLLDGRMLAKFLKEFQPNYIIHLASCSSVMQSWQEPCKSFQNNVDIFLNLIESVRLQNLQCRILSVGSSEEYGSIDKQDIPLDENHQLNPTSPYAVARVSQEMLSKIYVKSFGLDIVMTRSFNHIGPGQSDRFVIGSFAKQVVTAKKNGKSTCILKTGNLHVTRDFTDVRDVVTAYHILLKKGRSGEIYNVCSGKGYSLQNIIELLAQASRLKIDTETDQSRIRPDENLIIVGSNKKIYNELRWKPTITCATSLQDIIDYWGDVL